MSMISLVACHNDNTWLFWFCGIGAIIGGMLAGYDIARWVAAKEDGL